MDGHGKTILVTGATGKQGGATAAHLLAGGWHVRALVRDDATPAAVALADAGAELVIGNLDDPASLDAAMRGAHGVYSVQAASAHEVPQGLNVAGAAKSAGVQHLVYSSVGGIESQQRFFTRHGWGLVDKWEIEEHIRALRLPATILRPAGFMEDFTSELRFLQGGRLTVPFDPDVVVPIIAVDDIGAFAALAFARPEEYVGAALDIAGDALTAAEIADAMSRAIGRRVPHVRIPMDVLREQSPEAAKVFAWANGDFYSTDIARLRAAHAGLMDFDKWLEKTGRHRLATQLDVQLA